MNVGEINPGTFGTLPHYVATFIPLSLASMWFVVAMQDRWEEKDEQGQPLPTPLWVRLSWPVTMIQRWRRRNRQQGLDATVRERLPY